MFIWHWATYCGEAITLTVDWESAWCERAVKVSVIWYEERHK